MKALLFERQGQISRSEYFTGCIVLLISQYLLHIGGLALMVLSPFSQALTVRPTFGHVLCFTYVVWLS